MTIDTLLLEKQIKSLSGILNRADLTAKERESIECILNTLGDIADTINDHGVCVIE